MTVLIGVYVGILGLLIGSFLNVCIYRIPQEKSIIKPPSYCPACNTRLKVLDLIPIFSYLFLRGKCRHCGEKISPRYAVVEGLTSLVFLSLYIRFGLSAELGAALFLMTILIAVFFIDLEHMIIPDGLVITGLVGGVILTGYHYFQDETIFNADKWWEHLLGLLPGTGFLFVTFLIALLIYKNDEGMGMGDVKVFAPIGMILGWKFCLIALFLSIVLGGVIGILLIVTRIRGRKEAIPFGPYIVAGAYLTMLFGEKIISHYPALQ